MKSSPYNYTTAPCEWAITSHLVEGRKILRKLERLVGGMLIVRKKTKTYLVAAAELSLRHT
ncbi:MAG TPA: hypothetical protein VE573_09915 [Nitrososphaeraceae archaeon]|nr:hypothetical protein [Nitrososphaeraceae archaeon]